MPIEFEDPTQLREVARRPIKDGEAVLKAAGAIGIHQVGVEVHRNGKVETLPIPANSDPFTDAWRVYTGVDKPQHEDKAA